MGGKRTTHRLVGVRSRREVGATVCFMDGIAAAVQTATINYIIIL